MKLNRKLPYILHIVIPSSTFVKVYNYPHIHIVQTISIMVHSLDKYFRFLIRILIHMLCLTLEWNMGEAVKGNEKIEIELHKIENACF